jgi:REP element-mobilizing transposase RayT
VAPNRVGLLKIDKDCFTDRSWIREYLRLILDTCHRYGVTIVSVKVCNSHRKGVHYYIEITPPIKAELANMLQYLLGDDCQRVDHNRARIDSALNEWNKLFERPDARLRTLYRRVRSWADAGVPFVTRKSNPTHTGL